MIHQMTDIHQHLLWGLDDGAGTADIMGAMLNEACKQGISTVVATPHAAPGMRPFDMGLYRERLDQAQSFCRMQKLDVKVVPGAEVAWTYYTAPALHQGRIPTLGGTDYVLLELWRDISWQAARNAVGQLTRAGYCPVLAHAERYLAFLLSPKAAMRFRNETGALLQINANTLLHPRGYLERRFIQRLLSEGAIDAVATDAHDCEKRPVNLHDAYVWLCKNTDKAYAQDLTSFGGVFI